MGMDPVHDLDADVMVTAVFDERGLEPGVAPQLPEPRRPGSGPRCRRTRRRGREPRRIAVHLPDNHRPEARHLYESIGYDGSVAAYLRKRV